MDRDLYEELKADVEILNKVQDKTYAQHVYAAMCNMRWQPAEVWPVLKDQHWTCTWRYAGEVVANLRVDFNEDYMDWYCSGISGGFDFTDTEEHADSDDRLGYVNEGVVTDEIRADFARLGWHPSPWPKDKDL